MVLGNNLPVDPSTMSLQQLTDRAMLRAAPQLDPGQKSKVAKQTIVIICVCVGLLLAVLLSFLFMKQPHLLQLIQRKLKHIFARKPAAHFYGTPPKPWWKNREEEAPSVMGVMPTHLNYATVAFPEPRPTPRPQQFQVLSAFRSHPACPQYELDCTKQVQSAVAWALDKGQAERRKIPCGDVFHCNQASDLRAFWDLSSPTTMGPRCCEHGRAEEEKLDITWQDEDGVVHHRVFSWGQVLDLS